MNSKASPNERKVYAQIEEWKRKLIDLSHRNRLLYFRKSSPSVLQFTEPGLADIYTHLVSDEMPWSFYSTDEIAEDDSLLLPIPQEADGKIARAEFAARRRKSTEISTNMHDPEKLRKALTNLKRRSDSDFAERGLRILQVTFGLLEWRDESTAQSALSPLLLLPCELDKRSRDRLPVIKATEDELVLNPAIAVKLEQDFGLKLPALPDGLDSARILEFLERIQKCVSSRGWKVSPEVWCGLFSFHRMDIYKDLAENRERVSENPIVLALAREERLGREWVAGIPSDADLDRRIDPRDCFTIRDADSSQLGALRAISEGRSILIQGPPGTGKSQTIANCIADAIARGRRVLFVSDKMAALEVVFSRLRETGLESYVLELHSTKTKRQTVVNELHKTMTSRAEPKTWLSEQQLTHLVEKRKKLNEYVRAIGIVRKPLELSVRDVLGRLSSLNNLPLLDLPNFPAAELSNHRLYEINDIATQLSRIWAVVQDGIAHPWASYTGEEFGRLQSEEIRQRLLEAASSLSKLEESTRAAAGRFGLPLPRKFSECQRLARLLDHVAICPGIPLTWLDPAIRAVLRDRTSEYRTLVSQYKSELQEMVQVMREEFLGNSGSSSSQIKRETKQLQDALRANVSDLLSERETLDAIESTANDIVASIIALGGKFEELRQSLGLKWAFSMGNATRLQSVVKLCCNKLRPERTWFNPKTINDILSFLPRLEALIERRRVEEEVLRESYDSSFFDIPADSFLEDLRTQYRGLTRWLKPGFYKLRHRVRACRIDGNYPVSVIEDLRVLSRVHAIDKELDLLGTAGKFLLADKFEGRKTNCTTVRSCLSVAEELVSLLGAPSTEIIDYACVDSIPSKALEAKAEELSSILDSLKLSQAGFPVAVRTLSEGYLSNSEEPLSTYLDWIQQVADASRQLHLSVQSVEQYLQDPTNLSIESVIGLTQRREALLGLKSRVDALSSELGALIGDRFADAETNWNEVDVALRWTDEFAAITSNHALPSTLGEHISTFHSDSTVSRDLGNSISMFLRHHADIQEVSGVKKSPDELTGLRIWLNTLLERMEDIHEVLESRRVETKLVNCKLGQLTNRLRNLNPQSGDIPSIVLKAVLEHWIQWTIAHDSALVDFRREDHEQAVSDFKMLDRLQWQRGVHHIVSSANQNRKSQYATLPGGEPEVLTREAFKRGRHLPLRKLFSLIPNLLGELKPCLMMSPISVSQFLDPSHHNFDLVVFDEASQIRTEEAIGPIYRAKQVVICGDERQLPPTTFFEQGMLEEIDEDNDDESFDEYESILKACLTINLPHQRLRWHYRSRHETLITYSNRKFYSDRPLVTFASAISEDDGLGVKFRLVRDGIYDRGGTKRNVKEAEVVAETVMDVLRRFPGKTVGVVAFSVAQKEAIEDSIEDLSRREPELRSLMEESENRLSGFFVKNLESVQGDERDIMIISVGYGYDTAGRLRMNFGPLNRAGGERRLNVVVTRARELCIVISSISWTDFTQDEKLTAGARHLRDYLRYADQGPMAFEFSIDNSANESESPLEESVAAEIMAMGYDIHTQVGCSEYRIDIGVLSPYQPGRYILAVECDGATYHSTSVARDRDRLRQEVLEDLGWKVHRIWSVDWWKRRDREISKLLAAIEHAEREPGWHQPGKTRVLPFHETSPDVQKVSIDTASSLPPWARYYELTDLSTSKAVYPFHDSRSRELLSQLVSKVVFHEAPIHIELATRRLADVWGHQRITGLMVATVRELLKLPNLRAQVRLLNDSFLVTSKTDEIVPRVPQEGIPETLRELGHIPKGEITAAIENTINDAFSIHEDDLYKFIAKLFGFDRTGSQIRNRLVNVAKELVGSGRIAMEDSVFRPIRLTRLH